MHLVNLFNFTGNVDHPNCSVFEEKQKSFLQEQEYEVGWGKKHSKCNLEMALTTVEILLLDHSADVFVGCER